MTVYPKRIARNMFSYMPEILSDLGGSGLGR